MSLMVVTAAVLGFVAGGVAFLGASATAMATRSRYQGRHRADF
ncbi:hypothetical protein [Actinomadura opuntiae]|nr:hypothetical protein [Actinomadura sp. OS1-43]MDL4813454.1 hypothetical protein [Actinomadura sp. OS1-43]